jgi:hypothetical protein
MQSILNWWRNSHLAVKLIFFGVLALPQIFAVVFILPITVDVVRYFLQPIVDPEDIGTALTSVALFLLVIIFNVPAITTGLLLRALTDERSKRISFWLFLLYFFYNSIATANLFMMEYRESWDAIAGIIIFMSIVFIISVYPPLQYAMKHRRP